MSVINHNTSQIIENGINEKRTLSLKNLSEQILQIVKFSQEEILTQ